MGYDGTLTFDTSIDQAGFNKGVESLKTTAQNGVASIGGALSTAAIVAGLVSVGKASIKAASDLNEVQNVVDVTFGQGAEKVNVWAKAAMKAYGLSELAAKQYAGTIGAMLKSSGVAQDMAQEMSMSMAGLAGDFASFYNISGEEALDKIRSGLTGITMPLRQLGISMTVANLEAYALSQGIDKTYASMSQAEQITLRYNYLLSVSTSAQGDFVRTSSAFANTQRVATLSMEEAAVAIGQRLIPAATAGMKKLGEFGQSLAKNIGERGLSGVFTAISETAPVAGAAVNGLTAAFTALLIIRTVMAVMKGYSAVQASLTALEIAGTVVEWAEIGALSVKQIVVGTLTGKLSVAAAMQALWNTIIAANPVMAFVIALGALVAVITLVVSGLRQTNPELFKVSDAMRDVRKQNKELAASMKESADQFASTTDEADKQAATAYALVEALSTLSKGYTGSRIEQAKMDAIVGDLNSTYSDLNLSYDKNTGALSKNVNAIYDVIAAQKQAAIQAASMSRYTELMSEKIDAQFALEKARSNYLNNGTQNGGTVFGNALRLMEFNAAKQTYQDASQNLSDFEGFLADTGYTATSTAAAVDEVYEAVDDLGEGVERVVLAGVDVTDMLTASGMSAADAADRFEEYTDAALNMFDRINTKSDISVKDMIANWRHNITAVEDWGKNIEALGGKLPDQLLSALIAQGPEKMAGALAALAAASPDQLAEIEAMFGESGSAAAQAFLSSLEIGVKKGVPDFSAGSKGLASQLTAEDIAKYGSKKAAIEAMLGQSSGGNTDTKAEAALAATAAADIVNSAKQAVDDAVTAANFTSVGSTIADELMHGLVAAAPGMVNAGRNLVNGAIAGVNSRRSALLATMFALGKAATAAFNAGAQIKSPSKATAWSGDMLVLGVVLRVQAGVERVRAAVRGLGLAAVDEFGRTVMPGVNAVSKVSQTAAAAMQVPVSVASSGATVARSSIASVVEHMHTGIERFEPHYHVETESPAKFSQRVADDAVASLYNRV